MKILFSFSGSEGDGENNMRAYESLCFDKDVLRIYIKGCIYENVGNGLYFPDLEIAVRKIRQAFDENNYFDIDQLIWAMGDSIYTSSPFNGMPFLPTEIALEGLSRGGISALAVAKNLNELNIPLRVLLNQPVTGEIYPYTPLFSKYWDLSECNNILSANILLATHIDTLFPKDIISRQMTCRFSPTTNASVYFLPLQSHFQSQLKVPIPYHLGKAMAKWGYLKYPEEAFTQKIHYWYNRKKGDLHALHEGDDLCELFQMTELPQYIELYNNCFILLQDKSELYYISQGRLEPRECLIKDNELYYLRKNDFSQSQKFKKPSSACKVKHDYYFTPEEYRQSVFGAQSPIAKDPCYSDWLISKASSIIASLPDLQGRLLNEEKAAAIIAISKLNLVDEQWLQALLDDEEKFTKLGKIINKTEEIVSHLINTSEHSSRKLIRENALLYKKEIFQLSYEFFQGDKSDKQQFIDKLYRCELRFRQQALSLDSDLLRSGLKIITNFITHLSGVGLIINGINKYLTGNWLLFSHTQNENIIRDNRIDIVNQLVN